MEKGKKQKVKVVHCLFKDNYRSFFLSSELYHLWHFAYIVLIEHTLYSSFFIFHEIRRNSFSTCRNLLPTQRVSKYMQFRMRFCELFRLIYIYDIHSRILNVIFDHQFEKKRSNEHHTNIV